MEKIFGSGKPIQGERPARSASARSTCRLPGNNEGAVLVEFAFSFPILIILLIGIISYGSWLMVAHTVQQAANEGARAALAGISDSERLTLANESVTRSVSVASFLNPGLVTVTASHSGGFYSVVVSYDARGSQLFSASPVPLPAGVIRRGAVVKLGSV